MAIGDIQEMNKKGSQIDRLKVRAEEGDVSDDKCTNTVCCYINQGQILMWEMMSELP